MSHRGWEVGDRECGPQSASIVGNGFIQHTTTPAPGPMPALGQKYPKTGYSNSLCIAYVVEYNVKKFELHALTELCT